MVTEKAVFAPELGWRSMHCSRLWTGRFQLCLPTPTYLLRRELKTPVPPLGTLYVLAPGFVPRTTEEAKKHISPYRVGFYCK